MHKEDQSDWIFPIKEKFKLSENFLEEYKNKDPNWGPLGYIVYKRTYSRDILTENRNEEWWETCRRVVEGCYTIQINHCKRLKLPWDAWKSQKSAQKMYEKIFNFKMLPAGRTLYALGSDAVWKKGSAFLLNCSFVGTKDIDYDFSSPFVYLMDMGLCGVGVGYNTEGAGKVKIHKPKIGEDIFVIEDSREGWVDAVKIVLDSFSGKGKLPKEFDYSQIRPEGSPIVTTGGIAPGPEPLRLCINTLIEIYTKNIDNIVDSVLIVDTANILAKAVVSGGRRRSACISLGDPHDINFTEMKDYNKYSEELKAWRWASNNSVYAKEGMDYSTLIKQSGVNGEPGYVFLDKCKEYGRLKDGKNFSDMDVEGINPCLPKYAPILTKRGIKQIKELSTEDIIWSSDGWSKINKVWKTGVKKVFKYKTTAGSFYSTENHKILDCGIKTKIADAKSIDVLQGEYINNKDINNNDIIDGLLIGDGYVKKEKNRNIILLCVGKNDQDYFNSEIGSCLLNKYSRKESYKVRNHSIETSELVRTFNRKIPDRFLYCDKNKMAGFLRGLYSANGSVCNGRVTLKSSSFDIIERAQLLLSILGIRSYFTTNKPTKVKFKNGEYVCKQSYDLNISTHADRFYTLIGFIQKYKMEKLKNILKNKSPLNKDLKVSFKIIGREFIGEEEVFDINVDNKSHTLWCYGFNISNCGEMNLPSYSLCNLVESFPGVHETYDEFQETLKFCYLLAKTITLVPTHNERSNQIQLAQRRIGISMSGITQTIEKVGYYKFFNWCDMGYNYIKKIDSLYSSWLTVPKSIKITTIKPAGSTSLLCGATPGLHWPHSEYYIRRIRIDKLSPLIRVLKKSGYKMEDSVIKDGTTVVEIPIKEKNFKKSKKDVSIFEQLELGAKLQWYWSDNSVSQTVDVKPHELNLMKDAIELYQDRLKTVSFLPSVDSGYEQMPYETITEEQYEEMSKHIKPLKQILENVHDTDEKYCTGESCTLEFTKEKETI